MSTEANTLTRTVPLRGARGMIADKMVASLTTAAQLTHHARADVSALLQAKAALAEVEIKVSVEDLLMAALVRVLKRHPDMNGVVRRSLVRVRVQCLLAAAAQNIKKIALCLSPKPSSAFA